MKTNRIDPLAPEWATHHRLVQAMGIGKRCGPLCDPVTIITGALIGAAVGAVGAILTGGNILKGALFGAIGGAIGGAFTGSAGLASAGEVVAAPASSIGEVASAAYTPFEAGFTGTEALGGAAESAVAAGSGLGGPSAFVAPQAGPLTSNGFNNPSAFAGPDPAGAATGIGGQPVGNSGISNLSADAGIGQSASNTGIGSVGNNTGLMEQTGPQFPSGRPGLGESFEQYKPWGSGSGSGSGAGTTSSSTGFLSDLFEKGRGMMGSMGTKEVMDVGGQMLKGYAGGKMQEAKIQSDRAATLDNRANSRFGVRDTRYNSGVGMMNTNYSTSKG